MTFPFFNLLAGLIAGLLCGLGGALKDAPFEGFKPLTFLRSPIVGAFCGLLTAAIFPIYSYGSIEQFFVALCCAGWLERLCVEGYKIVRGVHPGKFSFGDHGQPAAALAGFGGFELGSLTGEFDILPGLEADHVSVRLNIAGHVQSPDQLAAMRDALQQAISEDQSESERLG